MKRRPITDKMKWQCLVIRCEPPCGICRVRLGLGDEIEWDHVHEIADDGPHGPWNIRPLHKACHLAKTKKATKQRAKIKRLEKKRRGGGTKRRPKYAPNYALPKLRGRPFSKIRRPMGMRS